jgi:predicted O-methyltransferase YrrM
VLKAMTITEPYTPEILQAAAQAIERYLAADMRVFEYGGGWSTVWFAGLCKHIVSVEHDPAWAVEIERALRKARLWSRVELIVTDKQNIAAAIDSYGEFDLVFVDCWDDQRAPAVRHALGHIKPGGWLVLDDSGRSRLADTRQYLRDAGWERQIFNGKHTRKTGVVRDHQTSIYRQVSHV